jgi:fructokinase
LQEARVPSAQSNATSAPKILVLGEALVDRFADTQVCGGAPFNLARCLSALGFEAACITRINDTDPAGEAILAQAERFGLPLAWIQREQLHATGVVDVHVNSAGQPSYTIASPAAWDFIAQPNLTRAGVAAVAIVCWGSLALRHPNARASIAQTIEAHPKALKFLDLNLRPSGPDMSVVRQALGAADWLKINEDELSVLARELALGTQSAVQVRALAQRFELQRVAVTLGAQGCMVFDATENTITRATAPPLAALVDTVGAGDAFSAGLLASHLSGLPLSQSLQLANAFAGASCTHRGPVSSDPDFFTPWRQRLNNQVTHA